jgi:hypothetical protein
LAVRAGQILFDIDGFVIDRIQTGGVNNLNINAEKISEVGDFNTVGIVRDIPDLSFEIQSLDVSTDIEALMCNSTPPAVSAGTGASPSPTPLSFLSTQPVDVSSPFRAANQQYNIVQGVLVPFLNLEQVQYRFGLRANAEETFTMRGDAIYYVPGVPVAETAVGTNTAGQTFNFHWGPAIQYQELGQTFYCLSAWWYDPATGLMLRLIHNQDYMDSASGFTLLPGAVNIPTTATVHYCYGTAAPTGALPTPTRPFYYGPNSNIPQSPVKPSAIRSKDMDVYVGVAGTMTRLTGVQSYDASWRVTLQSFEEFGNAHLRSNEFNFADVSGSLGLKGVNPYDTIAKIQNLIGIPSTQIAGALTYPEVQLECRLRDPETHNLLKVIYIPDAQFEAPPMSMRANQQSEFTMNFSGATGQMTVYKGERIGGEV